jgi:hypothetical protein
VQAFGDFRCHSQKVCLFTKRPHVQLTGKIPGTSTNWTSLAQTYPTRLSHRLASTLVAAAEDQLMKHAPENLPGYFGKGCVPHPRLGTPTPRQKRSPPRKDGRQL